MTRLPASVDQRGWLCAAYNAEFDVRCALERGHGGFHQPADPAPVKDGRRLLDWIVDDATGHADSPRPVGPEPSQ